MDIQGLTTTSLNVTGTSTFNNSLPTSIRNPTLDTQLTTKKYVDDADKVLDTKITNTDSGRKSYIDNADSTLNTRITDTDSAQKKYIDDANAVLDKRITDTDAAQKTYIDSYKPNDVIQMKIYKSKNKSEGGLPSTFAQGTNYTSLFTELFVSKSNNSTIQVIFDCEWGISGSTVDSWKSSIFINNVIIATKVAVFKQDNRQSSIVLFPISAAIDNFEKGKNIPISVKAAAIQSDPNSTLTLNTYNVTFIEIQN
jgi:hypothetical protein